MRDSAMWMALAAIGASACGADVAPKERPEASASALDVGQAAAQTCTTASVQGLSLQIIAEGNCIRPDAYAPVGTPPNLSAGSNINLFMERPARDALLAALAANPSRTLQVSSMLRTPAQQYLLRRWDLLGQCGIAVAANPGSSNHETGLAIDVPNYPSWTNILPGYGFSWLGSFDPVHFDYTGSGAIGDTSLGVRAFQRLHNRNAPGDLIAEDGAWGPQTEARLIAAPADGFAIGAMCAPPECARLFDDVCDSPFDDDINWLADNGYTSGCATNRFCPHDDVTRAQMAGFLAAALSLPPGPDVFTDDDGSPFEAAINAIAAAGITSGCGANRFCPDDSITRGQMAAFLTNAFGFPPGPDAFVDDAGSGFEPAINALAAAGVTSGCASNPPRFCPTGVVTREQMASFLRRSLEGS